MSVRVRVNLKTNRVPAVIEAMPKEIDAGVDGEARAMANELQGIVWRRYGYIRGATVARTAGAMYHAEVWVGYNRAQGFYSRFQEWGTIYQAPRPIVGPTAHAHEPLYAQRMAQAVKDACNAG
jgi:HK97 gp10 family phage protein